MATGNAQNVAQQTNPQDALSQPTQGPRSVFSNFKDDLNGKLQELQEELQKPVNSVNQRVTTVETSVAAEINQIKTTAVQQGQRLQLLEQNIHSISSTMVTKADLSVTLKEALQQPVQDLRGLLAKRSPDVTPTNEAKAPRIR